MMCVGINFLSMMCFGINSLYEVSYLGDESDHELTASPPANGPRLTRVVQQTTHLARSQNTHSHTVEKRKGHG